MRTSWKDRPPQDVVRFDRHSRSRREHQLIRIDGPALLPPRDQRQRRRRERNLSDASLGLGRAERPVVDRLSNGEGAHHFVYVAPPQGKQFASPETRQYGESHHRSREPRQRLPPADCPPPSSFEQRSTSVLTFFLSHPRTFPFPRWLFGVQLHPDSNARSDADHSDRACLSRNAGTALASKRTYLPILRCGRRAPRGVPRRRVCSYTQVQLTFSHAATSSTVRSSRRECGSSLVSVMTPPWDLATHLRGERAF